MGIAPMPVPADAACRYSHLDGTPATCAFEDSSSNSEEGSSDDDWPSETSETERNAFSEADFTTGSHSDLFEIDVSLESERMGNETPAPTLPLHEMSSLLHGSASDSQDEEDISDEHESCTTDDSARVAAELSQITSTFMYWALLLEPVDDVANTYKRVGLAMLYPNAFTALGVHPTEFDIE
jgi:hypothetical protein